MVVGLEILQVKLRTENILITADPIQAQTAFMDAFK